MTSSDHLRNEGLTPSADVGWGTRGTLWSWANILMSAPSWRWKFHLNFFSSPDDDVIVVFVIDLIFSLIFCTFFLTSSATMSKGMTICPQNVNMTKITKTPNKADQTRVWAWISTFEVCMHLSMRHMTMTAHETTWYDSESLTACLFLTLSLEKKQAFRCGRPWPEGADVHDPGGVQKNSGEKNLNFGLNFRSLEISKLQPGGAQKMTDL